MAILLPPVLPVGTPRSERDTVRALAQLPREWRLFHGVAWQQKRGSGQGDGEADVVLLHPRHGLIVLEVKGGDIDIERGAWHSTDVRGIRHAIKNPFVQATASKHALVKYLRARLPTLGHLPAGHAVAFPYMNGARHLGPAGGEAITLDGSALDAPDETVRDLIAHWALDASLSRAHIDCITELLAPTTYVKTALKFSVADSEAQLLRLTQDQYKVLDGLRRTRRAVIYGAAGSGKTVLAAERARRLAADGFSVLLICFNEPLGHHLREAFANVELVNAGTFHSFVMAQLRQAGVAARTVATPEWWADEAPSLLASALDRTRFAVDALVVDEGQDFRPNWFVALQFALADPDTAPIYVFADTLQAIYVEGWEPPPFLAATYDLETNCRNTRPIAGAVAAVVGMGLPDTLATGADPEYVVVMDERGVLQSLRGVLHRLLHEEGLAPDQVVVLAARRRDVEGLIGKEIAGTFLGAVDRKAMVRVETIHRFKGLESEVAIVILPMDLTERHLALTYVGISRARSHLVVIGTEEAQRLIRWPLDARS